MSAVDRLLEDETARRRALDLASFIVEAPAGAGKTELLTQRTLRLLATVEHPEEVLALTFTNKAATEMRDRILGSLLAATQPPAGELPPHKAATRQWALAVLARDRERSWGLLDHPGRLRVTTLDALCASLARQMPFLSRFGAQPAVAEDAAQHYTLAAQRTLAMLEAGDADSEVVATALGWLDNDAGRLVRLLVTMLARRDQWLQHAGRVDGGLARETVEAGFAALFAGELRNVARRFDATLQARLMPLARFAAGNAPDVLPELLDWSTPLASGLEDLPAWWALGRLLLTAEGNWRKALNKNIGFPAGKAFAEPKQAMGELLVELADIPGLESALAALVELPAPVFDPDEWSTVAALSRLLRLAAGQLWLVFQEAGEVDFIEIAARASLALGDDDAPTELAQALDYRISHLLVDEFQDTSPAQVALLARLMRGWTPDDGRTLFVVGDPMQSIYRFRKADVGLFLKVRERGIGDLRLEHLRLYRNNRSHPAIVDWVNAAFPDIFPAADDPALGAVRYAPSAATRAPLATSGVSVHPLVAGEGDDPSGAEARLAAELIQRARHDDPDGRIAVLVRARRHLDALVAELRRSAPELRFQAVEIEALGERQHVQDLLTLFHALHHRADRLHWLAMLRAPWCGLTLADLHALAAGDERQTVWQLMHDPARLAAMSDDGRQRLLHVRDVVGLALAQRDRQAARRWLEGVWLMLGGPRCLDQPAALADVEAFFDLVAQLDGAGRLNAETLAARVDELYAPPDPLGDAVQMMTIHKAKGLEFETVIVPGLHRDTGNNDPALLLWDEMVDADGCEHLLVAPLRARGGQTAGATLYDTLRRLEARRNAHETGRLLYVAATRAIRCLHLIGVANRSDKSDDGLREPSAGSFLKLLWPQVRDRYAGAASEPAEAVHAAAPAIDPATFVPPLLRLADPRVPDELAAAPGAAGEGSGNGDVDESEAASLAAAVGTLVHRCLELIAGQGLDAWPRERLPTLLPAWQRWLRQRGFSTEEAAAGAAEAHTALSTTLDSQTGRWLLAAHPDADAEQAWSSRDGERAVHHVIDRIFIADGVRWIVDYKTVRAPLAELPARAEGFRPQLERYAALFAAAPRPLKLAVWFVLQGKLVELE